ncbi:MAG: MFS transporter, partial [Paracoccaceae bacterium]|nr:MFS transporter [Paracoccaceae bacterium]
MGIGVYEVGFATLTRIYGKDAHGPITGITLIAGFASTIGWPLSGLMLATWGWREACIGWALIHLFIALPLNALLPKGTQAAPSAAIGPTEDGPAPSRLAMWLLAFVFAATWFNSTAMAAHLPGLLKEAGATTAVAIAAGALIGPAQVAARVLEFGLLRRFHPLV